MDHIFSPPSLSNNSFSSFLNLKTQIQTKRSIESKQKNLKLKGLKIKMKEIGGKKL